MKVAIVILNWNGLDLLKRFLPSVIKHSSDIASVFIADNGSDDGSIEWIQENFSDIGLIINGENLGFAGGYNKALEQIDSEYYVLLNSDVEVSDKWIDPIITYMDSMPDVAVCQPKILSYNNRSSFEHAGAAGGFIDKFGYPFCRGRIFDNIEDDNGQYDTILDIFWASGACMFIRSAVWRRLNGFDADFFAHMEEIDLCWRINSQDLRIKFIPDSTIYHLGGGTLSYTSPSKLFLNFRNNLFLLHKNLPANMLRRIILKRLLLDGIAAIKFLFGLNIRASLQVFRSHIVYYKHIPSLNRKRKGIVKRAHLYPENLILSRSIVYDYYIRKKRKFSDIWS